MIDVDTGKAKQFIQDTEYQDALEIAGESLKKVQNKSGAGAEWLGWRDYLEEPNDAILEQLDALAETVRQKADVFIVCGIGGSYLGARAVIDALNPFFSSLDQSPEIIYAGHHISGKYLEQLIRYLEQPKPDGSTKSVYLNVISKSGTTLETALSFRILRSWINKTYPEDAAARIICTTSETGGALNSLISENAYKKFVIPDDIGGRFSVLTPVGLLPIAVAGIDFRTLFYEAVSKFNELDEDPGDVLDYAATKYALYRNNKAVDIITTFEPELQSLGRWLQQLLGESEGKEGKGMLPAIATYSTDLHSLGQLIQQGPRNLMETFIKVEKPTNRLTIGEMTGDFDQLNYLAGRTFHDINSRAFEGTLQAHTNGGVPCMILTMEKLNAQHIGEFIYFYELMTAIYCYSLGINPFNQPGVEDYKKEMYQLLGKQKG